MCHVFRCDTAARTIANTLRYVIIILPSTMCRKKRRLNKKSFRCVCHSSDICKRIMIERSLQLDTSSSMSSAESRCATRPTDLPTENRRWTRHGKTSPLYQFEFSYKYDHLQSLFITKSQAQSFPTPMEEPKKVLKAQYLGSIEVSQPTGMEVINEAIETQLRETKREQWENVNVAVAPSMISINSSEVNIVVHI